MRGLAKRAVSALPFDIKYELFYQMGRALGVTAYQAHGLSGPIFGHLYDQTLMKSYLKNREWSSGLTALIASTFAEAGGAGTFYDIGANIGTVIVPIAANAQVHCVGFEPDPGNYELLSANVAIQGGSNIEVKRVAIADAAGEMRFTKSTYNSGDHRLSSSGEIAVQLIALDDLPRPTGTFVAKIDTQGAEPLIFQGGAQTLAGADLIISEFWPWGMARMGQEPTPILDFAKKHFSRGHVLKHGESKGAPDSIETVLEQLRALATSGGKFDQADLILVK